MTELLDQGKLGVIMVLWSCDTKDCNVKGGAPGLTHVACRMTLTRFGFTETDGVHTCPRCNGNKDITFPSIHIGERR